VGRVVTVARGFDQVRTATGILLTDRSHPSYRQAELAAPPAVGDWAAVRSDDGRHAVVDVLERHGTVVRRGRGERAEPQVVAANVDAVFCVFGLDRPLPPRRLERLLVLVHEGGAEPVIVLTKTDIAKSPERTEAVIDAVAPGTPRHATSVLTGAGLAELEPYLRPARTVALLGASGVGKSSLLNALAGADHQDVGEVRAGDRRGRHTTTARQLVAARGGGCLIDTPGVRALGLWDADDGISDAFPDVEALAQGCRFRDCSHGAEPGCAVLAAVEAGTLDRARYESYRALRAELSEVEGRLVDRQRARGEGARPQVGRRGPTRRRPRR
jgi:ribosome biogenesis GTPase